MGTLKYMNLLLQLYTPSKCQIYNIWTVQEHKCFSSFLFFRFSSNWEREREREREREVHKIGYKEKWSQSLLIIFLWWSSCGESFFFYGLRDFIIFLTLAWRKWLLRVSQNFFVFFYPEYLALVLSPTNPVQRLTFLLSISAERKESPLPFWDPSQSFGFFLLSPWPGDPLGLLYVTQVRLLSTDSLP